MIDRKKYLDALISKKENGLVKVITWYQALGKIWNLDIYVTGSNSKMLSSDILTEFRGRGDEEKRLQETRSLKRVGDSFKKIVVVKDRIIPWHDEDGVLYIGIEQFLLEENSLDL